MWLLPCQGVVPRRKTPSHVMCSPYVPSLSAHNQCPWIFRCAMSCSVIRQDAPQKKEEDQCCSDSMKSAAAKLLQRNALLVACVSHFALVMEKKNVNARICLASSKATSSWPTGNQTTRPRHTRVAAS
ncbi:hypothetical protein VFPFJ_07773 [Purpureocillium lilacinum]|uniref:Uncharacterized protein n=1 Tax=Purpureocillium lilacinum TaxID=33203 RepID=A0A179H5D4_PURLI|nr:hypothetical protein VFPFJ_07773 [Purpureocillium lilacinum]OAQ85384.1 hypothetical protein VFPFJ_07773 [Purpureocillium lilacinum]